MNTKRIAVAAIVCITLLVVWQYSGRIANLFPNPDAKRAEAAVAEMFDCWASQHYDKLLTVTFNNGSRAEVFLNMIKTPVTFKDLKIGKARSLENNAWLVPISVQLTDPASVMSSLLAFEDLRESMPSLNVEVLIPPKGEELRYIERNQNLLVFCSKDAPCAVDVCRDNENCGRKDNPLNYAMDAGRVALDQDESNRIAVLAARYGQESRFRQATWMKHVLENLGIDKSQTDVIASRAQEIFMRTPRGRLKILKAQMHQMRIPDPLSPEPAADDNAY